MPKGDGIHGPAECAWQVKGITSDLFGFIGIGLTRQPGTRRIEPAERESRRVPKGRTCPQKMSRTESTEGNA